MTAVRAKAIVEFVDELVAVDHRRAATRPRRAKRMRSRSFRSIIPTSRRRSRFCGRATCRPSRCCTDLTAEARAGYIGRDNRKEGRTAAWMIAKTAARPGKVGIIVGSHRYLCQETAEISFRAYFREHAPDFHVLEPLVNLEDARIAQAATQSLMAAQSRSRRALYLRRRHGRRRRRRAGGGAHGPVAIVCNELTPTTRAGLIDGILTAVIATPTAQIGANDDAGHGRGGRSVARRLRPAYRGPLQPLRYRPTSELRPVFPRGARRASIASYTENSKIEKKCNKYSIFCCIGLGPALRPHQDFLKCGPRDIRFRGPILGDGAACRRSEIAVAKAHRRRGLQWPAVAGTLIKPARTAGFFLEETCNEAHSYRSRRLDPAVDLGLCRQDRRLDGAVRRQLPDRAAQRHRATTPRRRPASTSRSRTHRTTSASSSARSRTSSPRRSTRSSSIRSIPTRRRR